jgi:hypothetical protein
LGGEGQLDLYSKKLLKKDEEGDKNKAPKMSKEQFKAE